MLTYALLMLEPHILVHSPCRFQLGFHELRLLFNVGELNAQCLIALPVRVYKLPEFFGLSLEDGGISDEAPILFKLSLQDLVVRTYDLELVGLFVMVRDLVLQFDGRGLVVLEGEGQLSGEVLCQHMVLLQLLLQYLVVVLGS
jgi:hypothetical protein